MVSGVYEDKIDDINTKIRKIKMSETEIKGRYISIEYEKIITTDDDCNHLFMEIYEKDCEICAKCGSIQRIIRMSGIRPKELSKPKKSMFDREINTILCENVYTSVEKSIAIIGVIKPKLVEYVRKIYEEAFLEGYRSRDGEL